MDYRFVDTTGSDGHVPQSYQDRAPRGTRAAVAERTLMGPGSFSRMQNKIDIQIHNLEKEAYSSVLRAFKAQADAITWEKESLITELRKELRVSNDEHRELLSQVNADDVIQNIREWRQTGGHETTLLNTAAVAHDPMFGSTPVSRKKPKTSHSGPSLSLEVPSSVFRHQSAASPSQPSFLVGIRGAPSRARGRPKGYHSGSIARGQSFNYGSSGAHVTKEPFEAAASDPLIGRKVMTRWPEDKHFYEAVITDYNPFEGRHALAYDIGTLNETMEWVNLKEIPSEDIRFEGEDPNLLHTESHGEPGSAVIASNIRSRSLKGDPKRGLPPSQNGTVGKIPDEVEIFHTDTLIQEVEKALDHSDRTEIEKAKSLLKEHEQALVDLIAMLAHASDGENEKEQPSLNQQSSDGQHGNKSDLHNNGDHDLVARDDNHDNGDHQSAPDNNGHDVNIIDVCLV